MFVGSLSDRFAKHKARGTSFFVININKKNYNNVTQQIHTYIDHKDKVFATLNNILLYIIIIDFPYKSYIKCYLIFNFFPDVN